MQISPPRSKALVVSAGLSFWFFIIINASGFFSIEIILSFVLGIIAVSQIFAIKLSKVLDTIAVVNTKVFLGILFIFLVSIYGIVFRLLRIDLLRLKKHKETYWLNPNDSKSNKISKQY